jgi:hypothetical protein
MRTTIPELVFVVLVLLSVVPFAIAFAIQHLKLPPGMRGLRPSSFRFLADANRDSSHHSHRLVRVYIACALLFVAFMASALVAWQFVHVATEA